MGTRKVFVSSDRVSYVLRLRNYNMKEVCKALPYKYDVVIKSVREQRIMPDILSCLADALNVNVSYLQNETDSLDTSGFRQGKWENYIADTGVEHWRVIRCSECEKVAIERYNFFPHCGAYMGEEE